MTRYSNITQNKRDQFKSALDDFCTFEWDDRNSWDFGAFIIANKRGDLKTINGLNFTNNYSKSQFESTPGKFQGITFNNMQINLQIGVYWISLEEYREFLNWLNPYKIANLGFSYNLDYSYLCKIAKIDTKEKYWLGYDQNIDMYYFELNIVFEIQGKNCAHSNNKYPWVKGIDKENIENFKPQRGNIINDTIKYTNGTVHLHKPCYKLDNNYLKTELDVEMDLKIQLSNSLTVEESHYVDATNDFKYFADSNFGIKQKIGYKLFSLMFGLTPS